MNHNYVDEIHFSKYMYTVKRVKYRLVYVLSVELLNTGVD